ncbi:gastrin-releasing peptide [Ochotona princeps]|uniref:gastrin-releasing peptide n=1 Tax=Ochotona princeps TaxID=9978 RepID=UPI0027149C63|nr:gastrin-releasing peptide [Ochotona princeps]
MRSCEFQLVLLALVLCQAPRGAAAPVSAGGGTVLAKMYPRGNHWAVGHLMGKKSTGELPYTAEGDSLKQQLRQSIQWEEAARNLLGLIEARGSKNHEPLGNLQPTWDSKESNNFEDTGSKHKESW